MKVRMVVGLLLVATSIGALAQAPCTVFGVSDGDTVTVRCGEGDQVRVRLAEIDAPEKAQAFGTAARKAMSDMVYRKNVTLQIQDTDRYGRQVAKIIVDGQDANFNLVRMGLAWCYDRYVRDRSCFDHQAHARAEGRGLWADANPIPPWEFRRAQKRQ